MNGPYSGGLDGTCVKENTLSIWTTWQYTVCVARRAGKTCFKYGKLLWGTQGAAKLLKPTGCFGTSLPPTLHLTCTNIPKLEMCGGRVINHKKKQKKNMTILLSINKHVENDILDIYLYHTVHIYLWFICIIWQLQLKCTMLCSFIETSSFPCTRPNRSPLFSLFQFDNEYQFNDSVKTLLSRLPKQRYLKSICEELHHFKIMKKYVGCMCTRRVFLISWDYCAVRVATYIYQGLTDLLMVYSLSISQVYCIRKF